MMGDAAAKPGDAQKYGYQFDGAYPEWKTFQCEI